MLGAPGDRNVTPPGKSGGAAQVAGNGSSAKAKDMQDELGRVKRERDDLKMQEELQRVKRERDELEKKLREMEAAKASPPVVAPPPPQSAGAAPSRAAAGSSKGAEQAGATHASLPTGESRAAPKANSSEKASEPKPGGKQGVDRAASGKPEPREDASSTTAAGQQQPPPTPTHHHQQQQPQQQQPPPPKASSKKTAKSQTALAPTPAAAPTLPKPAAAQEFRLPGAELHLPDFDLAGVYHMGFQLT